MARQLNTPRKSAANWSLISLALFNGLFTVRILLTGRVPNPWVALGVCFSTTAFVASFVIFCHGPVAVCRFMTFREIIKRISLSVLTALVIAFIGLIIASPHPGSYEALLLPSLAILGLVIGFYPVADDIMKVRTKQLHWRLRQRRMQSKPPPMPERQVPSWHPDYRQNHPDRIS